MIRNALWFTRRFIRAHLPRTALLVGCIALVFFLPWTLRALIRSFETSLLYRAQTTPLLLGSAGSPLDLTLHALYFQLPSRTPPISYQTVTRLRETGWCDPVPLLIQNKAQTFPVVGTTLKYFEHRHLTLARGSQLALLGDCLLGSKVAQQLQLSPGDFLFTDSKNAFDLAGNYPLKLLVTGILQASGTPDDSAVFTDLKTAWVIDGLGHGHQDLATLSPTNTIAQRQGQEITANAALFQYNEITDANRDTFHFHGNLDTYPLTAILPWPQNEKNRTLLLGRYQNLESPVQLLKPLSVFQELLQHILQAKLFFDTQTLFVILSLTLLMFLILLLSLRLREREMRTLYLLGCGRGTLLWIQLTEWSFIVIAGLLSAKLLSWITLTWVLPVIFPLSRILN